MDLILLAKAVFLGIVEGLTEFLPISSTGHLVLAGSLVNFTGERASTFEIAIQTGAIFAVMWEFRQRIGVTLSGLSDNMVQQRFAMNLLISFIPTVVLGLLFNKLIKSYLFHPVPVAIAFIVGAFIILFVEKRVTHHPETVRVQSVDEMRPLDALKVGLAQCVAMIPGTSRSGATIIGGMWLGLSRQTATEFSFFLAIPTLIGASIYSLYKARHILSVADIPLFAVGTVVAFISAMFCVRWLLRFVSTHSFVVCAYYRIAFGFVVLLTYFTQWVSWAE